MRWLAGIVVVTAGLWLIGPALTVLVRRHASNGFSPALPVLQPPTKGPKGEQAARLVAGLAIVAFAPQMRSAGLFTLFGWILVVTAAILIVLPWRWHQRFARLVVPFAIRHLWLFALGAFALGGVILGAVLL